MGVALFIVVEREIAGLDPLSVPGKFLARNLEWLDAVAGQLHVRTLSELISADPDEVAGLLEDAGVDPGQISRLEEQWHEPEVGMETVAAILKSTEVQTRNDEGLIQDLDACLRVLELAKRNHIRFHFAVDF